MSFHSFLTLSSGPLGQSIPQTFINSDHLLFWINYDLPNISIFFLSIVFHIKLFYQFLKFITRTKVLIIGIEQEKFRNEEYQEIWNKISKSTLFHLETHISKNYSAT